MIYSLINALLHYAKKNGLIEMQDEIYTRNLLLDLFCLTEWKPDIDTSLQDAQLPQILDGMLIYAQKNNLLKYDGITGKDLFDTKIMGLITPHPSIVRLNFWQNYKLSPVEATDYYYKLCGDVNYIRRDRIKKDIAWKSNTPYGEIDITINLAKPEKDPAAIAAAKLQKQQGYPKCMLCPENEGYAGRLDFPARQNHRIIPIVLHGEAWAMQYSPYVYYNEHCIVFNNSHIPMKIEKSTFEKLLSFVQLFPHYFVGSNADLPIVGGSILTHEHFQGGRYDFAMAKAKTEYELNFKDFNDIKAGIVKWPMSVIRLSGCDTARLALLADKILKAWRSYSNKSLGILCETEGEEHNTITPIARMADNEFQLDLVLRNNITTKEFPFGVFHPHAEKHHIKKENIGLIEVMGLAVLPSRLKTELAAVEECLFTEKDMTKDVLTSSHAEWALTFADEAKGKTQAEIHTLIQDKVGKVFYQVLEDAGVFKRNKKGQDAFKKFANSI